MVKTVSSSRWRMSDAPKQSHIMWLTDLVMYSGSCPLSFFQCSFLMVGLRRLAGIAERVIRSEKLGPVRRARVHGIPSTCGLTSDTHCTSTSDRRLACHHAERIRVNGHSVPQLRCHPYFKFRCTYVVIFCLRICVFRQVQLLNCCALIRILGPE